MTENKSDNKTMTRVRIRVTGVVQGVYYRASTRERARALKLSGWVRNTTDGAVELEAQGMPDALAQLVTWCRQGPPAARVADVDVQTIPTELASERGFTIRYSAR